MLAFTALTPIGARLADVRVEALDEETVQDMRRLLADHGMVVLPDQDVGDDGFLRFLRSFGQTVFTAGETPVPGFPDLNVITNVGRATPPRSTFHTDTSYVCNPPSYTALRTVEIPERGGNTLFTNQYAAYANLPARVRHQLEGRTITHVVTGLDLDEREETSAIHPIFRVHPVSGRTYLYLSTPKRCAHVSDMSPRLVEATIAYLFEKSTCENNVYRHAWRPGEVVIWDNRCVLHRADHGDVVGDRVLHRGMVADHRRGTDDPSGLLKTNP